MTFHERKERDFNNRMTYFKYIARNFLSSAVPVAGGKGNLHLRCYFNNQHFRYCATNSLQKFNVTKFKLINTLSQFWLYNEVSNAIYHAFCINLANLEVPFSAPFLSFSFMLPFPHHTCLVFKVNHITYSLHFDCLHQISVISRWLSPVSGRIHSIASLSVYCIFLLFLRNNITVANRLLIGYIGVQFSAKHLRTPFLVFRCIGNLRLDPILYRPNVTRWVIWWVLGLLSSLSQDVFLWYPF